MSAIKCCANCSEKRPDETSCFCNVFRHRIIKGDDLQGRFCPNWSPNEKTYLETLKKYSEKVGGAKWLQG